MTATTTPSAAQRVQDLSARLEDEVAKLVATDDWKAMLDVQARFHRYSFSNTILIHAQAAEKGFVPTRVMGFGNKAGTTGWKALGRFVKKGETAIKIFAPRTAIVEEEDPDTGEMVKVRVFAGFLVVSVFDESQTDGEPVPSAHDFVAELAGDGLDALTLESMIEEAGFSFTLDSEALAHTGGAYGVTNYTDHTVAVRDDISGAQRFKTTLHELAHVMLHDPDNDDPRPGHRGLREVEAESVAYIVSQVLGLDTSGYSFGYIASWSGGDPKKVRLTAERVQRAANRIIARFENEAVVMEAAGA